MYINYCFIILLQSCLMIHGILANPYLRPYAPYYSQCGQDKYLNEKIFKNKKNGFFVEIGAHDGISYSNTYYFEKKLGWKGVCIEPHPDRYAELILNRKALCVQKCIGSFEGQAEFLKISGYAEMLSGLKNSYDPRHLARIQKEIEKFGGNKEVIKVQVVPLQNILDENNVTYIDFLSLDTEGNELDILQSIDFKRVTIKAIAVEVNFRTKDIYKYLTGKGYKLLKTLGGDEIYIRK